MSVKLERRIGINAPDEIVWELLSDVPGWATWNPLYPRAVGEIRIHPFKLQAEVRDLALPDADGRWLLMEAELIEPDFYLDHDPANGAGFAEAAKARLEP